MNRRKREEKHVIVRNQPLYIHEAMRKNEVLGENFEKVNLDELRSLGPHKA